MTLIDTQSSTHGPTGSKTLPDIIRELETVDCIIIAALGTAGGISTSACAQECKGPVNIPIDDPVSAQTAKCLLSVDNRLLVNERCQVLFLPDGSEVVLDAGKHYARLSSTVDRRGVPVFLASWNRGSGRNDRLTPLGFVKASKRQSVTCCATGA